MEPNKYESIQALERDEETIDLSDESIATAHNSRNSETYWKIGRAYMERGDYDQALNWFREGINIDPMFEMNYIFIGWLYREQKQHKKALYWFKKALEVTPADPSDHHAYDAIATAFYDLGLFSEAIDFFTKEKTRNPVAKDFLLVYGEGKEKNIQKKVKQWVQEDLERIISLCAKHNTTTILQNYPDYSNKDLNNLINDVVKDLANKHSFYFVEQCRIFSRILKEGASREQYFIPDGHPNARGYGVMATNIYNTLQESNVLKFLKNP
jgi:tetratricopeptide (TPR) repeat protein